MSRFGVEGTDRLPLAVGIVTALVLALGALFLPFEARNSAAYGLNQSIDFSRSPAIAVSGVRVTPNYPNFNRLDLDLRAYNHAALYDLTIHIRPDRGGAGDVRTVPLDIAGERIRDDKAAFANPYISLRFPPIADSAGTRYYVWVERGPRNRDDIVTLWSAKTYSRVTGHQVIGAFLDGANGHGAAGPFRAALILLMAVLVVSSGWLVGATTAFAQGVVRGVTLTPPAPLARGTGEGGASRLPPRLRSGRGGPGG